MEGVSETAFYLVWRIDGAADDLWHFDAHQTGEIERG